MPFTEYLKAFVTESAANTYTEKEYRIPTSKTELMAMLIHDIWVPEGCTELVEGTVTKVSWHIAEHSMTTIRPWRFDGILLGGRHDTHAGDVEGTLSEYFWDNWNAPRHVHFDPPMLYARDAIWVGVLGAAATAPRTVAFVIAYTLEKVSRQDFIAALIP